MFSPSSGLYSSGNDDDGDGNEILSGLNTCFIPYIDAIDILYLFCVSTVLLDIHISYTNVCICLQINHPFISSSVHPCACQSEHI